MKSTDSMLTVLCVVGARPNFMKIAPIMREFNSEHRPINAMLVHTGQHYDEAMKASFFDQLSIPEPDVDLGVGSASHAVQTAQIMQRFEPVVDEENPDAVLVVGDVNSTIACALVAVKKGIPVIHVEAGLRSFDRGMPEEINRILTDQISEVLYTTERSALRNLKAEGIDISKIQFVGNVMIDTLHANLARSIPPIELFSRYECDLPDTTGDRDYGVVTLHRPANVDSKKVLEALLNTLIDISKDLPLIFPVHPRTLARIEHFGFHEILKDAQIFLLPPLGYLEMLGLMSKARIVLSDSGGIQEETTALGVPCLTLRNNTERPITVDEGTNTIVGSDPEVIRSCFKDVMSTGGKAGRIPEFWDGHAAERIAESVVEILQMRKQSSPRIS